MITGICCVVDDNDVLDATRHTEQVAHVVVLVAEAQRADFAGHLDASAQLGGGFDFREFQHGYLQITEWEVARRQVGAPVEFQD